MSAEILREAAALMRERAQRAHVASGASDWFAQQSRPWCAVRSSGGLVASGTSMADAEHIASWHPAVALAVADWLDAVHENLSTYNAQGVYQRHAFTVARAYLGTEENQ